MSEKKYFIFLWSCTGIALVFTISFLVKYLNDVHSALANGRYLAGYLVLFIPLSIGLYKGSDELGQKILLFYGIVLMFWAYGLLLSTASWLSLCLGLLFMCGWMREYDEGWSHLLFLTILLCTLLLGESIPQFGVRFAGSKDLLWAGLFDEFLHILAALLVIFPLLLSEDKMAKRGYLLAIMMLAAVLIDLDHIDPLLFLSTGQGVFRARTPVHSFLWGGIISLPLWFHRDKKFGLAFLLAHFSHILRDSYGLGRIQMLWPLSIPKYPRPVYPLGMVVLFLVSLGFHYRKHLKEGCARIIKPILWSASFALLTGLGIFFLKRLPPPRNQLLPQGARWVQKGFFLLLVMEIFVLSLWFPDKETTEFHACCPNPYLLSGVCSGLIAGIAYVLSAGISTLPYLVSLAIPGIFLLVLTCCQRRGKQVISGQ
ncbi:MAG: metal-dependent hydrolase [bacterium]